MKNLDAKLLVLVGTTLVAGLFAGRSILSSGGPAGDRGFDGAEPLPLGSEMDDTPALIFEMPDQSRNPFADGRQASFSGLGTGDGDVLDDGDVDPAEDTTLEG